MVIAPSDRANSRKPWAPLPGLGFASAARGVTAASASASSPSVTTLLLHEKECIASSLRNIWTRGLPGWPEPPRHAPQFVLEVHFESESHPAGLAQEIVRAPDNVIQRIRRPVLLRQVEGAVTVPVTLLCPNKGHAVGSGRSRLRGDPGGAVFVGRRQRDRSAPRIQSARLVRLICQVGAISRPVGAGLE